ncbi:hypothetical protein Taro_016581 [Colocasia esculenta]|uniref:Uncharacterized protein n=1 Tax=Colocasia esculenta TaxID=4460 RepID=A0A843UP70_COLES|nr:hypothetical protein [Colocasia esculenta]
MGITFRPGIRIAYVATLRNRLSEPVERTPVSRNFEPGARNATPGRVRIAPTPFYGRNGHNFPPGIRIAYVTTLRNRLSEPVERTPVSQNFEPGARNATPGRVY